MNSNIIAYFIAVVVFFILVFSYKKIMKRASGFWNWAGAFVLAVGLAGTILKITGNRGFKEVFTGVIFVLMGLSLYIFPKHR